jgi:hypothetical protein
MISIIRSCWIKHAFQNSHDAAGCWRPLSKFTDFCVILRFSTWPNLQSCGIVMNETTALDLKIRADNLKDDLIVAINNPEDTVV